MSFTLLRVPVLRGAVLALAALAAVAVPQLAHADTGTCTVSGTAFDDTDRSGTRNGAEAGRSGDLLYLFDSAGGYVGNATTDSSGGYAFAPVPCGTYRVEYASQTWWSIRSGLVPTTTGSVFPRRTVTGTASVDFGWRPIVRSTTAGAPIASYTGADGLRVESYDDAVSPADLYAAVRAGTVGAEASHVTVRFDLSGSSTTSGSAGSTAGRYDSYAALCYVTYLSWLDGGPTTLTHEYGHAWTLYRAYLVQQDPSLRGYLQARGLYGDSRVGSSYMWSAQEMVAEDYRQLLGSPTAAADAQANYDIPPASSVPGLRDYLLGAFSSGAGPAPSPTPTGTPAPSPSPTASAGPAPSSSPTAAPTPTPSPTGVKSKGSCRKSC